MLFDIGKAMYCPKCCARAMEGMVLINEISRSIADCVLWKSGECRMCALSKPESTVDVDQELLEIVE